MAAARARARAGGARRGPRGPAVMLIVGRRPARACRGAAARCTAGCRAPPAAAAIARRMTPRLAAAPACWWSRSAARCWSIPRPTRPAPAWLDGLAADIAALRGTRPAGDRRRPPAPSRSAAPRPRPDRAPGCGWRRSRPPPPSARSGSPRPGPRRSPAHGLTAAQLLLTLDDTEDRRRYLNARATLATLLGLGCVPVINENDTVATAEIRFGDNDRLAARVAEMVQADQLVLLSDIDGLYTADPAPRPGGARTCPWSRRSRRRSRRWAAIRHPAIPRGGMRTKLAAARIATQAGCAMAIALGHTAHPLRALADGRALHLVPAAARRPPRPQALDRRQPAARGHADGRRRCGARARRRRLAAAGRRARGRGRVRARRCGAGARPRRHRVARGLSAYGARTPARIAGHRSEEIEAILGWRGRDEMIHRDDLVLLQAGAAGVTS